MNCPPDVDTIYSIVDGRQRETLQKWLRRGSKSDAFVKSPDAALLCIHRHCGVR